MATMSRQVRGRAASRETSGAVLEPPARDDTGSADDDPVWRSLVVLLPALVLLIALEIAAEFTVAYLVTGRAY